MISSLQLDITFPQTRVGFPWFGNLLSPTRPGFDSRSGNQCRVSLVWEPNLMLRFGVLPSVDVACEEWLSLHAEMLISPNATNEAA